MDPVIAIVFVFGIIMGSFFYTLALRFCNGSMARDPLAALFTFSRCPLCSGRISPILLIPIAGFFLARGKCRHCGNPISSLYPVMELLFGIIALAVYQKFGLTLYGLDLYLVLCIAITIAVIDIKTLTIPAPLVIAVGLLALYPLILHGSFKSGLMGMAAAAGFFVIMLLIFPGSFGGGDLKYAAVLGLFSGLEMTILIIEVALVFGSITGVAYALISKRGFRIQFPFGPFLSWGLLVSIFWGRDILLVYFRILQ